MQITDLISQMGGLPSMAGLNENQVKVGIEALAPAILGGLNKQSLATTHRGPR